jgi:ATP-dependent DNA helicase DinG
VAPDLQLSAYLKPRLDQLGARARDLFDRLPYEGGRQPLAAVADRAALEDAFTRVDEQLAQIDAEMQSTAIADAPALGRRANLIAAELAFALGVAPKRELGVELGVLGPGDEALVRYTEQSGRHRAVWARPVDVAPILRQALSGLPAVFLSATLTVDRSFAHFRSRLGIDQATELLLGSPFDFQVAARLYVADDLPEPSRPEFGEAAAGRARALVTASGGGAFVLCTSHRMLQVVRGVLEAEGSLHVLVQGDAPRTHLIDEFRAHGNAVLVATMSFWQGVDVPGSALRLVVIDKLPFASPGDPVTAARLAYLEARGEQPFTTHQVPQAALLLRQGFGRLIRRKSDRGMVALLDRRVLRRAYGQVFLRSLPDCPRTTELDEALGYAAALRPPLSPEPPRKRSRKLRSVRRDGARRRRGAGE